MGLFSNNVFFSWSALAAELLLAIATVLLWRGYLSPLRDIPGPYAARFGRFWHIRHILIGDQNLQLLQLHEKYGHFVRIASNEVSVSHPDGVKKILLAQLEKGQWYTFLQFPDWRYKQPMSIVDPKRKMELSKSLAPAYSLTNILQQEDAISRTAGMLMDWLDRYAANGKPMQLDKFFTFTTFDIVGETVFSKQFGFLQGGTDVGNSIENSLALNAMAAVMGFFTPWHKLFINPITTALRLLPMGHLFDTSMAALAKREKDPDARFDIVAHWFRTHREHPDRLTIRDIQAQANTSVGAGADTASCALQAFVYYTLRKDGAWASVRREIDAAVAQGMCLDPVVTYADAGKLPYLQACIKEALRVFGPVPMGLPRIVPKAGLTIGDRAFPKGTIVSVNPWVIHYSKEIWGDDAHEFNPDRWLKDDANALDKYWIPFGAGYNSCPGQNLAKIEVSKICTTLVRDYDIRQVDPAQDWSYHAYFTVVPHDWPVYVEKRIK